MHDQDLYVLNILQSLQCYKKAIIVEHITSGRIKAVSLSGRFIDHITTSMYQTINIIIVIIIFINESKSFSGLIIPEYCNHCNDDRMSTVV